MRLVATPYRWLWRTWWKNVTHWAWDIRNGLANIPIFFSAVWWFRSWDWAGMVRLLKISAEQMYVDQANHVGSEREAKRLLVVRELCKRLLADKYFDNAGYDPKTWVQLSDFECRRIVKHSRKMAYQDAEYLGKMLKFVQHWWE